MAIIPMWQCDRDGKMFSDKKEAEEHDKQLELAANISYWIEQEVKGIPESAVEQIGLYMARNKELLMKAMKGKPDVLLEAPLNAGDSADKDSKVTAIAG